jgi:hypothetical protein
MTIRRTIRNVACCTALGLGILEFGAGGLASLGIDQAFDSIPKDAVQARNYELRLARKEPVSEEERLNYNSLMTREGIRKDMQLADNIAQTGKYGLLTLFGGAALFGLGAAIEPTYYKP